MLLTEKSSASHYSPRKMARATRPVLHMDTGFQTNFPPTRTSSITNRGVWAAQVHVSDDPSKKESLTEVFSFYKQYFTELKAKYHSKLKEYSSKDLYAQSVDKVHKAMAQWEEFLADCWSQALGRTSQDAPSLPIQDDYSALVETLVKDAERMMANSKWKPVSEKDGISVWKMYLDSHPEPNGHKYPLVKAQGIIDGSPEEVLEMMVDSSRVKEYNKFSNGRDDLQILDPSTKVVWNRTWPPLCKQPHDFCSVLHARRLPGEGWLMVTKAAEHPGAPAGKGYKRSKILLGVSVMKPVPGQPKKTELTTYNHVYSAGIPVLIADKVSVKTAADFITNVNRAFA